MTDLAPLQLEVEQLTTERDHWKHLAEKRGNQAERLREQLAKTETRLNAQILDLKSYSRKWEDRAKSVHYKLLALQEKTRSRRKSTGSKSTGNETGSHAGALRDI